MQLKQFISEEGRSLLAVALACLFIGFLLDELDRKNIEATARREASQVAADIVQNLNVRINRQAIVLGRLVSIAELSPHMTQEIFHSVGARILQDVNASSYGGGEHRSSIMSVAMAPNLVVTYVYPMTGNTGLVGLDYRDYPNQLPDAQAALLVPTPVVSRPFVSVQGSRALAIRQRYAAADGTIEGLVSVAVNLDSLFSQLARKAKNDWGHHVSFDIDKFAGFGDRMALGLEPITVNLETYGLDWSIAVAPTDGWPTLPLITQSRLLVAIVGVLLITLVHLRFRRTQRQRRRETRLEKAIDTLSAGFVIFNKEGRLVHWNDTYRDMFGYGSVLTRGMRYEDILREGLKKNIFSVPDGMEDEWVRQNLKTYLNAEDAIELKLNNGRWIKSFSRKTEYGDTVGVRYDVTEFKTAQLVAERMSAAKSEFMSVLSHELRTPLTIITGFGKLLENDLPVTGDDKKDAFVKDALSRMLKAGQELSGLIEGMLDYVHVSSLSVPLNMETQSLSNIIDHQVGEFEPIARRKTISLQVEKQGDLKVVADRARVKEIIENLLSNAVKFTGAGGTIHLSATTGERFARVTISDSGKGIPNEKLSTIFEEFTQVSPSGQRREGGIGMGLAKTKRLVEMQGGTIEVKSTEGTGSAFTFSLPLASVAA